MVVRVAYFSKLLFLTELPNSVLSGLNAALTRYIRNQNIFITDVIKSKNAGYSCSVLA
jgi:hypothetical protein